MSGGHFQYQQQRGEEIAQKIDSLIASNNDERLDEWGEAMGRGYPPVILAKFAEASHTLRRAAEMAQRVDYLISGDDGYESFLRRWDTEVRPEYIFPAPSGVDETPPVATLPADHGITLWGVGAMDAAGGAPELQWDIEIPCQKCDGTGDVECCESGQSLECPACAGEGTLQDLGDFIVPEKHKNREEMERIILDHNKCHYDHKKLCRLNPRAKESYGAQLTATVAKLTEALKALI